MPEPVLLAYDLGTGGLKTALYSRQGERIGSLFAEHRTVSREESWAEQDPQAWWAALCSTSRSLLEERGVDPRRVAALSFSGQMMACLPVDRRGEPLRDCIIWADRRSLPQAERLKEAVGEPEYYRLTGNKIYPTYPLPKFMWLKENEPEVYRSTFRFLQPKDYLVLRLTGIFCSDYSDGSGTAALDMSGRRWAVELVREAGIEPDKLPELHASTEQVGTVSREAAAQTGLAAGTPVVIGAGDGPCGNLGVGVYREGSAYTYLGTSSWVSSASRRMVADPGMVLFNICSVDPRLTYVYGTMQMGGGSFQWLKETVCDTERRMAELTGEKAYVYMSRQAERSPPGAKGLLFLPYLRGERSPRWNPRARGAFVGLTAGHTRADLIRAVMEGVAYNLKIIRDALAGQQVPVEQMRAIGGGAESALWRQIIADVFQEAVHVPALREEANPLGAAILAGVGAGLFPDFRVIERLNPVTLVQEPRRDPQIRGCYEKLFALFNRTYEALEPIFGQL